MGAMSDMAVLCSNETVLDKEGYGGKLSTGAAILSADNTAEFLIVSVGQTFAGTCTGAICGVKYLGKGVGIAGGSISAGDRLQTDSAGKWTTGAAWDLCIAIATEAATTGQRFNLIMQGVSKAYPEL